MKKLWKILLGIGAVLGAIFAMSAGAGSKKQFKKDLKDNKKKFKMSLGKSEVKVDPDVKIGVAAGGNESGSGNLY